MAARNDVKELAQYLKAVMENTQSYLSNNENSQRLKGMDTRDRQQYLRGELHAYDHIYDMCKAYLAREDA